MSSNNKPNFEVSVDTVTLAKSLKTLAKGDFISYEEMNALLPGRQLQKKDRHILHSACRLVLKDNRIVMGCVHGKGLKRLTDEEASELPMFITQHIRRRCKRTLEKTSCVDMDNLQSGQKTAYILGVSIVGALFQFTQPSRILQIEDRIKSVPGKLSFEETIKIFMPE